MKRPNRIALEILAPAPIGALVWMLGIFIANTGHPILSDFDNMPAFLGFCLLVNIFSYLFGILPSLLSSLLLEMMFSQRLKPSSWRAVGVAGLLGTLAGVGICLEFGMLAPSYSANIPAYFYAIFAFDGLITGLIIGLIIRWSERRSTPLQPIKTGL